MVYVGLWYAQGTVWGPCSRGSMWSVTLTKTTSENPSSHDLPRWVLLISFIRGRILQ